MAQQLQSIGVTLHQIDSLKEEGGKQHQKRTTKKDEQDICCQNPRGGGRQPKPGCLKVIHRRRFL